MRAIKNCEYVWISHGHPDHLSAPSLDMLKDKKILLPDHVGGRIANVMRQQGFHCVILQDRVWTRLSPRIRVLCIADYNQDALLLVDIAGTLVVDLNDTNDRGWGHFVKSVIRHYEDTFLLRIFGYGDADMINFFDENNVRIEPQAAKKLPIGKSIALTAERFGIRYVIPFSSLHRYQRSDSVWANAYTTPLDAYAIGFTSNRCEDYLRHRIPYCVCRDFLSHVRADTRVYQFARKTWRFAQAARWI